MDQVAEPETGGARVLRVEGELLVMEFEAPWDAFLLPGPGDPVLVHLRDGSALRVLVKEASSTRRGPHARGLTLRLAVRLTAGSRWPAGPARLSWKSDGRDAEVAVDLP